MPCRLYRKAERHPAESVIEANPKPARLHPSAPVFVEKIEQIRH
jgi:hypothetical protein